MEEVQLFSMCVRNCSSVKYLIFDIFINVLVMSKKNRGALKSV